MSKRFVCRVEQCSRDGLKAFEVGDAFQALCPDMEVALEEGFMTAGEA